MDIDRLSALPDDLLRHILYFAPAKEGASTDVLSRRWRSLWPTSGAVNIDSRFYRLYINHAIRKAFFRGADAAIAAAHAHGPIKRFSLLVEADGNYNIRRLLHRRRRLHSLLSSPAIQHVEEFRIGAAKTREDHESPMSHTCSTPDTTVIYKLNFGALPSEALRVLHIINCRNLKSPSAGATFPQLVDLRLQGCIFTFKGLQRVVDGAPRLATLYLESFHIPRDRSVVVQSCYQLDCPTVTSLVLRDCSWLWTEDEGGLELHVPNLRYFVFKSQVHLCHRLSLSPYPNMAQVDLHLTERKTWEPNYGCSVPLWFWQFIRNFNSTKVLKLKLDFTLGSIAVVKKKDQDELLRNNLFSNLERLELEVNYYPASSKTNAMALANCLHCCPVVRDLHLKLKQDTITSDDALELSLSEVAESDFDKSVNYFRRHKRRSKASMGGDHDHESCHVSDIPSLSKNSFHCLKSHLRRVTLKFWMDNPNCFGVGLAKFLAKKAMVLEEMVTDDGSQIMCDHINRKIGRWMHTNSSKRKIIETSLELGESYGMEHRLGKHQRR